MATALLDYGYGTRSVPATFDKKIRHGSPGSSGAQIFFTRHSSPNAIPRASFTRWEKVLESSRHTPCACYDMLCAQRIPHSLDATRDMLC